MAKSISCNVGALHLISTAPLNLNDMSVIGFEVRKEPGKEENYISNLYFLFLDEDKEPYIIKHSFLLNRPDDDIAYFNHPLHEQLNMDKMNDMFKEKIKRLFKEFSHTNSFYTDAKPIYYDFKNNKATIKLININLADKSTVKEAHISYADFFKLTTIINDVIFRRPIPLGIDKDISYDNYRVIEIEDVKYLGADKIDESGQRFLAFYGLQYETVKRIGVAIPVITPTENIMTNINEMKVAAFNELYKDNFMCDLSKMMMMPVLDEIGALTYKLAINRLQPAGKRDILLTKDSPDDSALLNPIKYIFSN